LKTTALTWRKMAEPDLVKVECVGDAVHPDYPEDAIVIAERLRLYPAGCLVLDGQQGVQGYAVAHPRLFGRPPPLNTTLDRLPAQADTFYIHELAIMPDVRSGGSGTKAVDLLAHQAQLDAFTSMSLVAVGSSPRFWRRNGFEAIQQETTQKALATYEDDLFMARVLR
jgi:hypothetical protein